MKKLLIIITLAIGLVGCEERVLPEYKVKYSRELVIKSVRFTQINLSGSKNYYYIAGDEVGISNDIILYETRRDENRSYRIGDKILFSIKKIEE